MLTQERLKELLDYDPETGVFTHRQTKAAAKKGKQTGNVNSRGYVIISVLDKSYAAHRLAWLYTYGYWPKTVDHINRDKSNNRLCNLREVTPAQNTWNAKLRANNSLGYEGVTKHKASNKYRARIQKHGKRITIGAFDTPEAANAAYIAAKEKLHIID